METLNISRAQTVIIVLNDYDKIPLTLTYNDFTDPNNPTPIDIRPWAFSFDFKTANSKAVTKNYPRPSGGPDTEFLAVTGADNNVLDMSGMWMDIKSLVTFNGQYRLIQLVTDTNGNSFVHMIYLINAQYD